MGDDVRGSRRGVAATAVAVVLGMLAAALVVLTSSSRPDTTVQALDSPTSTSSSTSSSTTTSTSTSTTAVPTTVTPASTTSRPTTTTAPPPRTRTLRTESGSITFDVTIEPASPRTGEVVEFRIDAVDREGGMFFFGLDTGDEPARRPIRPTLACTTPHPDAPRQEPSPTPPPSSDSRVVRHSYRVAGDRGVKVYVGTVSCSRPAHEAEATTLITVLPGESRSNGPQEPTAWVLQSSPADRPAEHVLLAFGGTDADGYVRRLTLDWGDGSPPAVIELPMSSCVDREDAYPSSAADDALEHVYPPGRYVATTTIVSTGCDGRSSQRATASVEITVDG